MLSNSGRVAYVHGLSNARASPANNRHKEAINITIVMDTVENMRLPKRSCSEARRQVLVFHDAGRGRVADVKAHCANCGPKLCSTTAGVDSGRSRICSRRWILLRLSLASASLKSILESGGISLCECENCSCISSCFPALLS